VQTWRFCRRKKALCSAKSRSWNASFRACRGHLRRPPPERVPCRPPRNLPRVDRPPRQGGTARSHPAAGRPSDRHRPRLHLPPGTGCQRHADAGGHGVLQESDRIARVSRGGLGRKVWQNEKFLLVDDVSHLERPAGWQDLRPAAFHRGHSLEIPGRVEGVIGLAHVEAGKGFREEDVVMLERFAGGWPPWPWTRPSCMPMSAASWPSDARGGDSAQKRGALRLLLESSPDPIVVYNLQGEAVYVNPASSRPSAGGARSCSSKHIDFVPEESWPETREAIGKHAERPEDPAV